MNSINQKTFDLIKSSEGLRLEAYPDPATGGEPITIGYGTTIYPNGIKVKLGDTITKQMAEFSLLHDITNFSTKIYSLIKKPLNDNQFGALVSFSYNVGIKNLQISTLLKKVNENPNDLSIKDEFLKWKKAGGKVLPGLLKRRIKEAELYFS